MWWWGEMDLLDEGDPAAGPDDGAAALPGGGGDADADVDALAEDLQAPLILRDDAGKFLSQLRRRRAPEAPSFRIIEEVDQADESAGPAGNGDAGPSTGGDGGTAPAAQYRTWLIRGPVRGWSDDGWRLSVLTTVRALAALPSHEVYARSMAWLVPGTYTDEADFLASVKFVVRAAVEGGETWDADGADSSFQGLVDGQDLDDDDVREVLRQASNNMRRAARRILEGHVALVGRRPAVSDPVHQAAVRALLRQRSIRAVADYRRKGAAAMRSRWRQLLRGMGAGTVALMRRVLELDHGDSGRSAGRRAHRVRLSWGSTQMRLLPTPAQMREDRRRAFDAEDRVPHHFFTRRGARRLVRWDYVRGSGSSGVRRYRSTDGEEKRLRAYSNRYWQAAEAADGQDADDVSEDEDDGVYFNNPNAETEGCYAPLEQDPEKLRQLIAHSHSYLENDDSTGEERILAVAFGAVEALQQAIDGGVSSDLGAEDMATSSPAVATFAADGGCVRGKMITAFTIALAWPHLKNGRTHLVPLVYSLSGEKDVDKLVARAVRDTLQEVMLASFTVPVASSGTQEDHDGVGSTGTASSTSPSTRIPLKIFEEIQVCGTLTGLEECVVGGIGRWEGGEAERARRAGGDGR